MNDSCAGILSRHSSSLSLSLAFVPYSVHLARTLLPLWLVLGVPGSLLSLAVWSSRQMRSSSSIYLCALAVLDAAFLLMQQLPWHLREYYDVRVLDNRPVCWAFPVYSIWMQYLSPALILGFTVERYIGICHPFSSHRLCTVRRALAATGCLSVGCLLVALMQLRFYHYDASVQICTEDKRILEAGTMQHRFYNVWTKITEVLFFAAAPLTILAFNLLVLVQVRRSAASGAAATVSEPSAPMPTSAAQRRQPTAATVTLLSVSFYQIGAMLPVTALLFASISLVSTDLEGLTCNLTDAQVRQQIDDGQLPQLSTYFAHLAASHIVNSLAVSHNALKFFVYLATGALFRRKLARLLCTRRLGVAAAASVGGGQDRAGRDDAFIASVQLPSRRTSEQRRRLRRSVRGFSSAAPAEAEAGDNAVDAEKNGASALSKSEEKPPLLLQPPPHPMQTSIELEGEQLQLSWV